MAKHKKHRISAEHNANKEQSKIHTQGSVMDEMKKFYKKNKKIINVLLLIILLVIPMYYSAHYRSMTYDLPKTREWAYSTIENNAKTQIIADQKTKYPNMANEQLQQFASAQYKKIYEQDKERIDAQADSLSSQFQSYLQDDDGQTYLVAIDPYVWYGEAKQYLVDGKPGDEEKDGKFFYSLRNGRNDVHPTFNFHVWSIATTYRIMSIFGETSLFSAAFAIPLIFGILMIIPAFFIGRRLTGSDWGGFFAGMIMAVHGALLTRTVAGFSDTDIYTTFFPLLVIWLFLEGFHARRAVKKIILYALSGFSTAFFLHTWSGWWYIFLFVILGMMGYIGAYIVKELINSKRDFVKIGRGVGEKIGYLFVYWFSGLVMAIAAAPMFFESVGHVVNMYLKALGGPLFFISLKNVVNGSNIWPNVLTTVAELNAATVQQMITTVGSKILLFLVLSSLALLLFKDYFDNKKARWYILGAIIYNAIFTYKAALFTDLWGFIGLAIIPAIVGIILYVFDKEFIISETVFMQLLLFMWIAGTFFAATKGVRFIALSVPAVAIGTGVGVVLGIKFVGQWLEELTDWPQKAFFVIGVFLALFLLISPINQARAIATNEVPSFNDGWNNLLQKIDKDSADGLIASWWDFGHWFVAMGNTRVVFDGGDQGKRIHWIGRSLETGDEHESMAILRMLNCKGEQAYYEMLNITNDNDYLAITRLKEIIMLPTAKAKIKMKEYGYTEQETNDLLALTHCEDLLPMYYIASEDMVGKAGVWAHFGAWNFTRAKMYSEVKKIPKAGDATTYLETNFGLTQQEASKIYGEIMTKGADQWVSSWPQYYSGEQGCSNQENIVTCQVAIKGPNGGSYAANIVLDMAAETVKMDAIDGGSPEKAVFIKDGEMVIIHGPKNNLGLTFKESDGKYSVILGDQALADSIFTRMFFLEGKGLKYMTSFDFTRTMFGQRIYTYKLDWDSYLANYN